MNFRLTIQYDGTGFHGWQMQGGGQRTVQGELERALALVEGRAVTLHGAGRTDAGVHAEAQVASVHLQRDLTPDKLCAAINGNTGRDVRVIDAAHAPLDFHARFDARGKTYCYRIFRERFMSPFWARYAHQESRPLDLDAMRESATFFLGEHDWTAFSSAHTDVTTRVRRVTSLEISEAWTESGRGRLMEIRITADGFLRYMVRSIAGTLLAAGRGDIPPAQILRALRSGDRSLAAATAPAHGLTLLQVHYQSDE